MANGRTATLVDPRYVRRRAPRAVLATLQTASSAEFLQACRGGAHLFLVADEVHRLGASRRETSSQLESGPRLGLSATPERAGDPDRNGSNLCVLPRRRSATFHAVRRNTGGSIDAVRLPRSPHYPRSGRAGTLEQVDRRKYESLRCRSKKRRHPSSRGAPSTPTLLIRRARIDQERHAKGSSRC